MTWLLLAVLAFVIVWNGFFVAAEYAFVASRPSALAERANEGSERAADVIALQQDPTRFVAAVQVAITMSSLAAGAIGEPAVRSLLEPLLDPVGDVTGRIIATTISIAVAFAIVTALTVVLGEIIPKTFTLGRAEQVALLVIRPVQVFNRVFRPFIALLSWLSHLATRALGLPEPEPPGRGVSAEELKQLVAASREEGVLEAEASEMINRVVDFGGTEVRQVMVPRPDVVALSMEETVDGAVELIARFPHTRYPIFESDLDDVAGIVHARELLEATRAGRSGETLRSLARPSHFVPETATLDEVMRRLRRQRARMAIVLDEYGSLSGVVTLEDLLEEIVGEIEDEYDVEGREVRPLGRNRWLVAGTLPLADLDERFSTQLAGGAATSVGGEVFAALGRLPEIGDTVTLRGVELTVRAMSGTRIEWLVVELHDPDDAGH